MINLRWYQTEAVKALYDFFIENENGNPLLVLPTGTGKSLIIAEFVRSVLAQYRDQRILIATHVKELIAQDYGAIKRWWPQCPIGIYSAGLNKKETMFPVTICGVQSAGKKARRLFGRVDLVVIDEAHLVSPKGETTYRVMLSELLTRNPRMRVIGLTATPYRLGSGYLTAGGIFTDIAYDLSTPESFKRLVEEKYLAPLVSYRPEAQIDLDGVHKRGGEYVESEIAAAAEKVTDAALTHALKAAADRKHILVFCSGVNHAQHVKESLEERGETCGIVTGDMDKNSRSKNLSDFTSGRTRFLVNANILTTGFDYPGIDAIIILRPTASTSLHVQMLGRATRPAEGKENALILDYAGNIARLGPIDDPVIKLPGKGDGTAPVKTCGGCNAYVAASTRICPQCGFEFPEPEPGKDLNAIADVSEAMLANENKDDGIWFDCVDIEIKETDTRSGNHALMITYRAVGLVVSRWLLFDNTGWTRRVAMDWWIRNTQGILLPTSVSDAYRRQSEIRCPKKIKVKRDAGRYWKIVDELY